MNNLIEKEEAIVAKGEVPVIPEAVIAMNVSMIMIEGIITISTIDVGMISKIDIGTIREKSEAVVHAVEVLFAETNA